MEQKPQAGRGDQEHDLGTVAIIRVRDRRAGASVSAGGGEKQLGLASVWGPSAARTCQWMGMGCERKRELRGQIPGSGAEQPRRYGALNGGEEVRRG